MEWRESGNEDPECEILLGELWPQVRSGTSVILEHSFSGERCHATMRAREGASQPVLEAVRPVHDDVVLQMILGRAQKAIALEHGISGAAVTLRARRWLQRLGLSCKPSLVPLFLLMAGISWDAGERLPIVGRLSRRKSPEGWVSVCSFDRPDRVLPSELSEAEQQVARHLVEGRLLADIAERRGTAIHTVANQVGAVFAKLGVSGRFELVRSLSERAGDLGNGHSGQQ